jgi:pentapeptide MXKDX repeat protein
MTQVARCNTPRRASEVASIVQIDERVPQDAQAYRRLLPSGSRRRAERRRQIQAVSPPARLCPVCGDNRRNLRRGPIPAPRAHREKVHSMTSKLKIFIGAAAFVAFGAVASTNVALADDVAAKPDAMSADHMSADHMSSDHMGTTNKPTTTKHAMEGHMAKPDTMSSDHMAPEAPKQ